MPKKIQSVLLLSSQFNGTDINHEEKKKPEIVLHYNATIGGVDNGDKVTREYLCVRSTRRWPFRLFMGILDMGALNAYMYTVD